MRTWCSLNFFPIPFPMFSSVCTIYFYFSHQIFMVEDRRQICSLVCLFPYTQHKNNNSHGFSLWFFFQFSFLTAPVKEALWLSKQSMEVIRINWRSLLMTLRRSGWKSATSHNFITTSAPPLTALVSRSIAKIVGFPCRWYTNCLGNIYPCLLGPLPDNEEDCFQTGKKYFHF